VCSLSSGSCLYDGVSALVLFGRSVLIERSEGQQGQHHQPRPEVEQDVTGDLHSTVFRLASRAAGWGGWGWTQVKTLQWIESELVPLLTNNRLSVMGARTDDPEPLSSGTAEGCREKIPPDTCVVEMSRRITDSTKANSDGSGGGLHLEHALLLEPRHDAV